MELMLEKENRRKKEVYEGPSDLVYRITDVRENQEPPLGAIVSSNIGGYSGQVREMVFRVCIFQFELLQLEFNLNYNINSKMTA